MKAKEIADQFIPRFREVQETKESAKFMNAMSDLLGLFMDESNKLVETRHVGNIGAYAGVVLELNNKWNAVVARFEKELGASPVKRNAYLDVCLKKTPDLEAHFNLIKLKRAIKEGHFSETVSEITGLSKEQIEEDDNNG